MQKSLMFILSIKTEIMIPFMYDISFWVIS